MNKKNRMAFLLLILMGLVLGVVGMVQAQTNQLGSIRGAIYQDVNGDGVCVNTGVTGENPLVGVPIEFVSSDEAVVITLTTGDDGTYGLVAAGQSIWRVTAQPDATKWHVTSENPLYPPVLPETGLIQTDVNFCVASGATSSGGGSGTGNAVIVLPESGASATNHNLTLSIVSLIGSLLIATGLAFEWRRRQA